MTSSGDSGGNPAALLTGGTPMPGLPIAGSNPTGDPYKYGQFQNFLPDVQADGQNPSATGLRPDMFNYRKPGGDMTDAGGAAGGGSGDIAGQIQGLRDQLAKMQMGGGGGGQPATVGTMGLGAGGGGMPGMSGGPGYPLGGQGVADLVAGQTPFAAWGGGSGPNDPMFRRGVQQGPIDWRAKDAAAAAAAAKPPEGG
jgi:hypothetical protein